MTNVIIGASGGIGRAFVKSLLKNYPQEKIYAFSRSGTDFDYPQVINGRIDITDESSIETAAASITEPLKRVIVATGILHNESLSPEKTINSLSLENMKTVFEINTFGPALIARYFLPKLVDSEASLFAAISARVGSISDNGLGGWYSYRASKTALNMVLKTASIEVARKNKNAVVVGLHPGTVDTDLSKPFKANVPEGKLFDAEYSVQKMMSVIEGLTPSDTGNIFAWDGEEIAP